ncbi:hypothetical protein GCM10009547_43630 [Sporichthya brevicatena]|uniref:Uncharacterized protein n=1 Tax=Sporichthya brevicatena TaxID=171442 RepID=A0ABN1H9V9_9ACTN
MEVQFTRRPDNGTVAEFTRADGVRVRVDSYDRTGLVPHDASHLLIERAFRLAHGFWGCVSDGAVFATVEIVAGRTKYDHRARSAALVKEHSAELGLAERVVGTVLNALAGEQPNLVRDLTSTWAISSLPPPPRDMLAAAAETALADLRDLQRRWACLPTGGTFALDWPAPRPARRR